MFFIPLFVPSLLNCSFNEVLHFLTGGSTASFEAGFLAGRKSPLPRLLRVSRGFHERQRLQHIGRCSLAEPGRHRRRDGTIHAGAGRSSRTLSLQEKGKLGDMQAFSGVTCVLHLFPMTLIGCCCEWVMRNMVCCASRKTGPSDRTLELFGRYKTLDSSIQSVK